MAEIRKYGEATTILFPLIDAGTQDFESTPVTHAAGDTQISKDEGAFANTTNAFAHEGNGIYSLALTATEMQAARIAVTIIDSATKAWEDQAVIIETIGHGSSQFGLSISDAIISGATSGTPTTTASNTDITGYADDELIGRTIIFVSGTAAGQSARITDYANTSGVVTYTTIPTAPAASDTFIIL